MNPHLIKTSKFLSLVLRHEPERIGLVLDTQGWASVEELLFRANEHGVSLSRDVLDEIVATNEKRRFALSADGLRIRASQGHSIEVDLALAPQTPPNLLFHGTAGRFLDSIRRDGLLKMSRQHVHLSADEATAIQVGQRHGKPVVLQIDAARMAANGIIFYLSANQVWLVDAVPPPYLTFPES